MYLRRQTHTIAKGHVYCTHIKKKIEKKWSTSTYIDVSCFLWERGSVSIGGILNQVIYKAVVVLVFFGGWVEGERGDCLTAKIFKAARIC